jgi:hypothetical protein
MELSQEERRVLVDVLQDRLGSMREQVYHADTSTYRDELKRERDILQSLIKKFEK